MTGDALPDQSVSQLAHFEARVTVLDKPSDRRRWNGDPMASSEASAALWAGVDAFKAALRAKGFEIVSTQFSTTATEIAPLQSDETGAT